MFIFPLGNSNIPISSLYRQKGIKMDRAVFSRCVKQNHSMSIHDRVNLLATAYSAEQC